MSRCLYLEYGAGCGCSECMSGYRESRRQRSPIEVETERLRIENGYLREIERLKAENASLRAALEPQP